MPNKKLSRYVKQLGELMSKVEALHCQCDQCKKFRDTGEGDDLCFEGRRVMQIVYAFDVANSVCNNLLVAKDWADFGPHNQTCTADGIEKMGPNRKMAKAIVIGGELIQEAVTPSPEVAPIVQLGIFPVEMSDKEIYKAGADFDQPEYNKGQEIKVVTISW